MNIVVKININKDRPPFIDRFFFALVVVPLLNLVQRSNEFTALRDCVLSPTTPAQKFFYNTAFLFRTNY